MIHTKLIIVNSMKHYRDIRENYYDLPIEPWGKSFPMMILESSDQHGMRTGNYIFITANDIRELIGIDV